MFMPKEHTKQSIGDATLEQRDLRSLLDFFFFKFVRPRWVGYHPQEDLVKFGYRSKRKVEKFRNSSYILVIC
jgi:hypothetical protein